MKSVLILAILAGQLASLNWTLQVQEQNAFYPLHENISYNLRKNITEEDLVSIACGAGSINDTLHRRLSFKSQLKIVCFLPCTSVMVLENDAFAEAKVLWVRVLPD